MTTTSSDKLGIMFNEVMSGGFALGHNDPATGAQAGKSQPLTMHGSITIDDLDAFIANPAHLGRLDVRMDWAPFGTDIPALGGVFNLFSPTGDPHLKLMVYEWGVTRSELRRGRRGIVSPATGGEMALGEGRVPLAKAIARYTASRSDVGQSEKGPTGLLP